MTDHLNIHTYHELYWCHPFSIPDHPRRPEVHHHPLWRRVRGGKETCRRSGSYWRPSLDSCPCSTRGPSSGTTCTITLLKKTHDAVYVTVCDICSLIYYCPHKCYWSKAFKAGVHIRRPTHLCILERTYHITVGSSALLIYLVVDICAIFNLNKLLLVLYYMY